MPGSQDTTVTTLLCNQPTKMKTTRSINYLWWQINNNHKTSHWYDEEEKKQQSGHNPHKSSSCLDTVTSLDWILLHAVYNRSRMLAAKTGRLSLWEEKWISIHCVSEKVQKCNVKFVFPTVSKASGSQNDYSARLIAVMTTLSVSSNVGCKKSNKKVAWANRKKSPNKIRFLPRLLFYLFVWLYDVVNAWFIRIVTKRRHQ